MLDLDSVAETFATLEGCLPFRWEEAPGELEGRLTIAHVRSVGPDVHPMADAWLAADEPTRAKLTAEAEAYHARLIQESRNIRFTRDTSARWYAENRSQVLESQRRRRQTDSNYATRARTYRERSSARMSPEKREELRILDRARKRAVYAERKGERKRTPLTPEETKAIREGRTEEQRAAIRAANKAGYHRRKVTKTPEELEEIRKRNRERMRQVRIDKSGRDSQPEE